MESMVTNYQSFWQGKSVLITGHTGFKGSWLLIWLISLGAKVHGYSLKDKQNYRLFNQVFKNINHKFQHFEGDIRNPNDLNRLVEVVQPEIVFHLAAQPLVIDAYENPLKTWNTNLIGSLNLLEALNQLRHRCAIVMVTTDKVYKNNEWIYGYRENDELGGHDPYSASKAAAEIAIGSWRASFVGTGKHQNLNLKIATARAGNVIGGGDWAINRIVPDSIRSLQNKEIIHVRNPSSTRPWQHVLEPLGGYLLLAEKLMTSENPPCEAFNFGPNINNNRSVSELIETILTYWSGNWADKSDNNNPHEAGLLNLQSDKARHILGWMPKWSYKETIEKTIRWYRDTHCGADPYSRSMEDIDEYQRAIPEL